MVDIVGKTTDGLGTLRMSGGGYRLQYDVTNLQSTSHQAAARLLDQAKKQDIVAKVSYLVTDGKKELTIVFDGSAKAGRLLGVGEAEVLFIDTARAYAESAQRYSQLMHSEAAAVQLKLANQFNPTANYTLKNPVMRVADAAEIRTVELELAKLQGELSKNLQQFTALISQGKLDVMTQVRTGVIAAESGVAAKAAVTAEAADSLTLVKSATGALGLVGTAGTYFALLEGMLATTKAVQDQLHQDDLRAAQEAQAVLDYAKAHPDRRNHDACLEVEECR